MSIYGNVLETSKLVFQFDKIFSNRHEMDLACAAGTDNIYAGRFVLVKYDSNTDYTTQSFIYGYSDGGTTLYADAGMTMPYIFSTFTQVSSPSADDWEDYYYLLNYKYVKLLSRDLFNSGVTYYTADADANNIVGANTILQLKDEDGNITKTFYHCLTGTSGEPAAWETIITDANYQDYFTNFWIDAAVYGAGFDERGYDATVWQKSYRSGAGEFILIARLNATTPGFELVADVPSMNPTSPYVDGNSTDNFYRIKVPSHWGLQMKPAEIDEATEEPILSDQLDATGDPVEIYMNLGGPNNTTYHINESHKDTTVNNEILLTPTGKSGRIYDGEEKNDTLELSVHMPAIGNMIDTGYDLIYGPGRSIGIETDGLVRARDINWYDAEENALQQNGATYLGGKTYDLTSLAGIINTMHNRLGQIIKTLNTKPGSDSISQYSSDYIYYIEDEDKYYRIGPSYQYTELTNADYVFTPVEYNPITYITDTYYYKDGNEYLISKGIDDVNDPPQLYQKSVAREMYHEATDLVPFLSNTYFVKQGVDYIRDNASQPSYAFYPNGLYYQITNTTAYPGSTAFSGGEYMANSYYYLDDNDNYILDTSDEITINRQYYQNVQGTRYNNVYLYMKNKFYYVNGQNSYSLCTYDTVAQAQAALGRNAQLYWLEFDETIDIVTAYEHDGIVETIIGHPLKENGAHPLGTTLFGMINAPSDTNNFYLIQNNNYIAYKNINYNIKVNGVPAYALQANYIHISSISTVENLYVTGKYYYINSSGSYIKSFDHLNYNTIYYSIDTVIPINQPFYIPDTYFYESSENYYEIDHTETMTSGRTYYTAEKLYVIADYTNRCPYGYEWSSYSVFVPASVTLGRRVDGKQFVEIFNFMQGGTSINADLLWLEKYLEKDNADTRDKNTIQGSMNLIRDKLFVLDRLIPRQVLFVNDFGQITSSTIKYSDLLDIINKHDAIMNL